jgi:hypothetical protein
LCESTTETPREVISACCTRHIVDVSVHDCS